MAIRTKTMVVGGVCVAVVAGLTVMAAPAISTIGNLLIPGKADAPSAQEIQTEPTPATGSESEPTADPSPTPTADSNGCLAYAQVKMGQMWASIDGELQDNGPRPLAEGRVGRDESGRIVSYTVAAGDAPDAIGARLCIENTWYLSIINHTRTIHPDQVLRLVQDEDAVWAPFFGPPDAEAGYSQITYQAAMEEMAAAAEEGNVDAMRAIWNDRLLGAFVTPENIAMIQQALDDGDLDVLNQMFS